MHSKGVTFLTRAGCQDGGYGQRGRNWISPYGNMFLTACFIEPQKFSPGKLSISIGVLLAKIIQSFLPNQRIELKWPNDLLLNRKKCGGVIIEVEEDIHIGIGINIATHPENTNTPATHLGDFCKIDINALLVKIIENIENYLKNPLVFDDIRRTWWSFAKDSIPFWHLREPINGNIIGIDEQGYLLIESEQGQVTKRYSAFQ